VQEKKAAYIVRVPRSHSDLVTAIKKLCEDMDKLIKEENSGLPRLYCDPARQGAPLLICTCLF